MKQTIYYAGNNIFKDDKIDTGLVSELKRHFPQITFEHLDPTDEFPIVEHFILIDTIMNTKEVVVIKDIEKIVSSPTVSVHDLDIGMSLKLAQKMGNIKDVTIIGLPPKKDAVVLQALREAIKKVC